MLEPVVMTLSDRPLSGPFGGKCSYFSEKVMEIECHCGFEGARSGREKAFVPQ